jgi:trimethylamine corrinoid protein
MSHEAIYAKLQQAIESFDEDLAREAANEALEAGISPLDAIQSGLSRGMSSISDLFDEGELFVPQILLASDAFEAAVTILTANLTEENREKSNLGKILIHTVQGDIHDVGKNIVKTMLSASGYKVYDLGRDVPVEEVVARARELQVDIIAGSALMTTTMPAMRDIIRLLDEEGIRNQFKCLFGGAPVSREWVAKIGGDGYADNASEAIAKVRELLG